MRIVFHSDATRPEPWLAALRQALPRAEVSTWAEGAPAAEVVKAMTPKGVVPGYPLGKHYPGMENVLLLSCTEANNRTQIDKLAEIMGGLL